MPVVPSDGLATIASTAPVVREGWLRFTPNPPADQSCEPSARALAAAEDERYVMTFVYDAGRNQSDFLVLNAHDFRDPSLAVVPLPQRVPFGFHGSWVPDE